MMHASFFIMKMIFFLRDYNKNDEWWIMF